MTLCAGCELPIQDRFLLNLLDRPWHVKCVQCHECKACLTDRCFYRNSKIYCRTDFYRLFGQKCSGCLQGISPNDLIRRAKDKVFHLNCFTCMICNKQLSTGEELYVVNDTKFICKEDVLGKTTRGSDAEDDCDMDSGIDTQGGNVSDKEYQLDNDNSRDDKENVIAVNNNNNNSNYLNNNSNTNGAGAPSGMVNPTPNGNPGSNGPPPPMGGAPGGGPPPHGGPPGGGPPTNGANGPMLGGGTSATPLLAANLGSPGGIKEEPGLGMMLGSPATPNSNVSENSNLGPEGQQGRQSVGTNSSAGNCGDGTAPSSPLAPTPEGGAAGGAAKSGTAAAGGAGNNQVGAKRRGPRTTIKAKQLETLKAAFAATPKPTRHIREQLANETGLNMRVIQVWFQNRRSKERRMKQLSAMGARHHRFYRGPRRMRGLRPGDDMDSPDMMGPGFGYIGDNGQEYYPGYQGYTEFFMGQGQEPPMGFLPNSQGTPPLPMDGPLHPPSGLMCLPGMPDGQYMPGDLLPPASTPEPLPPLQPHEAHYGPPRSLGVTPFSQSLSGHHHEMAGEAW